MSKIQGTIISILVERCAVLTVSLGDILVVAAPPDVAPAVVAVVGRVAPAADEGVATEVAVAIVKGAAASLVEVLEQVQDFEYTQYGLCGTGCVGRYQNSGTFSMSACVYGCLCVYGLFLSTWGETISKI